MDGFCLVGGVVATCRACKEAPNRSSSGEPAVARNPVLVGSRINVNSAVYPHMFTSERPDSPMMCIRSQAYAFPYVSTAIGSLFKVAVRSRRFWQAAIEVLAHALVHT